MKQCWRCGNKWQDKRTPGMRDECEECFNPWHSCRNCRFYDGNASQWCREPMAREEKPRDVEAGNSCSYLLLSDEGEEDGSSVGAKEDLAALFGDATEETLGDAEDWMKPGKPKASPDLF